MISGLESYQLLANDVVIHVRCAESHYLMTPRIYYYTILEQMKETRSPDNIYLVSELCAFGPLYFYTYNITYSLSLHNP